MTNSTDQERQAFEAEFPLPEGIRWNGECYIPDRVNDTRFFVHLCSLSAAYDKLHAVWQARAQLQPASVAVPELSGIGRDAEHPRAVVLYLRREPSDDDIRAIQERFRSPAAPHPVSGEQKRITSPYLMYCLGAWWTCEERQVNAALDRNYRLIDLANPPAPLAAQDVAGLVEALEAVLAYDESAEDGDGALLMHYADMLKKVRSALFAHQSKQRSN